MEKNQQSSETTPIGSPVQVSGNTSGGVRFSSQEIQKTKNLDMYKCQCLGKCNCDNCEDQKYGGEKESKPSPKPDEALHFDNRLIPPPCPGVCNSKKTPEPTRVSQTAPRPDQYPSNRVSQTGSRPKNECGPGICPGLKAPSRPVSVVGSRLHSGVASRSGHRPRSTVGSRSGSKPASVTGPKTGCERIVVCRTKLESKHRSGNRTRCECQVGPQLDTVCECGTDQDMPRSIPQSRYERETDIESKIRCKCGNVSRIACDCVPESRTGPKTSAVRSRNQRESGSGNRSVGGSRSGSRPPSAAASTAKCNCAPEKPSRQFQ